MSSVSRIALVFISFISIFPTVHTQHSSKGILKGRVLDQNRAAMPNIKITIENQTTGAQLAITTDMNGAYQVFIDAGRYKMKTLPNSLVLGYERATLNIFSGETVIVNFHPTPISIEYAPINEKPSRKYIGMFPQIMILHFPQKEGLYIHDVNVEFETLRCQEGKFIFEKAIFTLGRRTVFADKCIIDKNKAIAMFEGNVKIEENDILKEAKQIEIDLASSTTDKRG